MKKSWFLSLSLLVMLLFISSTEALTATAYGADEVFTDTLNDTWSVISGTVEMTAAGGDVTGTYKLGSAPDITIQVAPLVGSSEFYVIRLNDTFGVMLEFNTSLGVFNRDMTSGLQYRQLDDGHYFSNANQIRYEVNGNTLKYTGNNPPTKMELTLQRVSALTPDPGRNPNPNPNPNPGQSSSGGGGCNMGLGFIVTIGILVSACIRKRI